MKKIILISLIVALLSACGGSGNGELIGVEDRENINNWIDQGSTDIIERAHLQVNEILKTHFPKNWDDKTDNIIRDSFPVRIPKNRMQSKILK